MQHLPDVLTNRLTDRLSALNAEVRKLVVPLCRGRKNRSSNNRTFSPVFAPHLSSEQIMEIQNSKFKTIKNTVTTEPFHLFSPLAPLRNKLWKYKIATETTEIHLSSPPAQLQPSQVFLLSVEIAKKSLSFDFLAIMTIGSAAWNLQFAITM